MSDEIGRITEFQRDGLTFGVLDEGPIDGEPIVLLHGFPERSCWRYVAPKLNAAGYRTLAMDQRGYAPGARPKRRRDYRITELTDDVGALIDLLPERSAHVVGHDWGAAVAWSVAMTLPEKVRTLTAVSVAHPAAFLTSWVRSTQLFKSWYMFMFQLPVLPERILSGRGADKLMGSFGMTAADIQLFREEIVDAGALTGGLNWYRAMPFLDPRSVRTRVAAPTTLVWSDDDAALGRWAADKCGDYVDAPFELVVLEGVSHWIPTKAPDALSEAILERVMTG